MASIREALEAATSEIGEQSAPEPVVEAPAAPAEPAVSSEPAQTATERARDEAGKFAKSQPAGKSPIAQAAQAAQAVSPAVEAPLAPPSSWKKDYWDQFKTLPPALQKYVHEREGQFASGVSTYKQEAERAATLYQALAPFQEDLQRYNIDPATWIGNLGRAHQTLAKGSPEQKLQMFQKLAQEYGVNLHAVQTGQIDPLTQYIAPLQQQVQALTGQLSTWQQRAEQQEQAELQNEVQQFAGDVKSYPHFEAVRPTMIRLLETGYADDLKGAYEAAVRLDPAVFEAEQQRQQSEQTAQAAQARQQRVQGARANAVSPRSDTPSGNMSGDGKKGLRSNLESAAEAVLGGGRV